MVEIEILSGRDMSDLREAIKKWLGNNKRAKIISLSHSEGNDEFRQHRATALILYKEDASKKGRFGRQLIKANNLS